MNCNQKIYWLPVLALFCLLSCKNEDKNYAEVSEEEPKNEITKEEREKRGEYLITSMGCHDCHTPKKMGEQGPELVMERALSGFQQGNELPELSRDALEKGWMLMNNDLTAAVGPWGVSFAANLTSHESGIGSWNFEQFKRALTEGKFKGQESGRMLLPPMPWQNFTDLTEEDLQAIFDYLQSTEPIDNAVPPPIPPNKLDSLQQS